MMFYSATCTDYYIPKIYIRYYIYNTEEYLIAFNTHIINNKV